MFSQFLVDGATDHGDIQLISKNFEDAGCPDILIAGSRRLRMTELKDDDLQYFLYHILAALEKLASMHYTMLKLSGLNILLKRYGP
jgi:hypothetical protein